MDILDRFWRHADRSGGEDSCYSWLGSKRNTAGYGAFQVRGKSLVAHRWLAGYLRGTPLAWPEEVACHTCDNKSCVNPRHIYIGSHTDNANDAIGRLNHGGKIQKNKTHCVHGHEFTEENTYWFRMKGYTQKFRYCRTCKRESSKVSQQKMRDKKKEQRS